MASRKRLHSLLTLFLLLCVSVGWWALSLSSENYRIAQRSTAVRQDKPVSAGSANAPNSANPETDSAEASPAPNDPAPVSPAAPIGGTPSPQPVSTRSLAVPNKSVASILEGADLSDPRVRARVVAEMAALQRAQQESVEEKAERLGVPLRIDGPGHKVAILYDFRGDEPLYRTNKNLNASISTGANLLLPSPYNLSGNGIRVGVWDGGSVRNTHQEFTGRVTKKNASAANDDHATHVAGTIAAAGIQAAAKGMAPAATIDSYDWNADYTEMTAAGTASATDTIGLPLSNHSYGYDAATEDMGRYEAEAASVDAIAASLPFYLPFWAAGNEQNLLTAKGGFQSITFNGLAKNILTIGAVNDAVSGGVRNIANATIADFSSLGPCDDGRIKPDLVANGVGVYSSVATSNTSYDGTYDGTSMATPNALGSAILIEQLYAREFSGQRMRASTLKSLLIQTADDRGNAGPDYTYGWGLMNVKAAADLLLAHKNSLTAPKIIEGTLTNTAKTATHTFTWDGVSPIRATLCWTEPAGVAQTAADSRTPNVLHNLDAKITAPNGTLEYQPYVMPFVNTWSTASMSAPATTGKNNVDNVEQVYIATPGQAGIYTVTVTLDGTLTTANQVYSLIISGGASATSNPAPEVTLTSPANGATYLSGNSVTLQATATDLNATGSAGAITKVEFFEGTNLLGTVTAPPYTLSWTPGGGSYAVTARATDSEGAVANSPLVTVHFLTGTGAPTISNFTPSSGRAGESVVLNGGNFAGVTAVRFGDVEANFTINSLGQLTATVPTGAATGRISIVNGYGIAQSSTDFTIITAPILISQIFGAGGNSGATYNRDYVEIYNRSGTAVSLSGWSLQYTSANGTTWQSLALSGTVAAGKYFLIGLGSGSAGAALPAVDMSGTIQMSANSGKVALLRSTSLITGRSPEGNLALEDFVGFGTADAAETLPAPSPSSNTAIFRLGGGTTDTGNNAVDFVAASPAPRNSSTVAAVLPVISSASSASGTVGTAFSYQISATNLPQSYAASGLPAGLTVNTSSGLISGTPTAAGISNATISAINAAGQTNASLTITINPAVTGPVVVFSENMGTPSGTTTLANFINGTAPATFQNKGVLTYTQGAQTNPVDVRTSSPSSGYAGASGNGNLWFTNNSGAYGFSIESINASGVTNLSLNFGYRKESGTAHATFAVDYWNGTAWITLANTATALFNESASAASAWYLSKSISLPLGAQINGLKIRFVKTGTEAIRIDDVKLTGTPATSPALTVEGTLTAVNSVYGSASPVATTLSVSGTSMNAGILITPPAGFEVSQTNGISGFAATQTIGAAGTITPTTVYLRLSAGIAAGSYSGNVLITSPGAADVSRPVAASDVRPKLLTITARDRTKPYGTVMNLGANQTQFSSNGLVGTETIGSVTLSASGGTAATDAPGTYQISPSAASGGTFSPNNYDIDYQPGVLTVTPRNYADWLLVYPALPQTAASADPDGDGQNNLMEYFSGTHPGTANPPGITIQLADREMIYRYRRAKGITGVTGSAQWSADLTNLSWTTAGITETAQDMGDHEQVTATLPLPVNTPRRFMRLNISQP